MEKQTHITVSTQYLLHGLYLVMAIPFDSFSLIFSIHHLFPFFIYLSKNLLLSFIVCVIVWTIARWPRFQQSRDATKFIELCGRSNSLPVSDISLVKTFDSRNRLSGTGLTINRLPAEWTTWVKELAGMPNLKETNHLIALLLYCIYVTDTKL